MGRLELFLSEVSWHAGVLERMAWPSARPSGFSTPSLLSLLYSRALLLSLSLSLPFLPAPHWFLLSRSPCHESERTECLSFLSAHTSSQRCDSTGSQSAHSLFHWSRNSTATSCGSSRLPFVAEIVWFARKFRPCAGLDDYRVIATRSVDDSSAAATS